MRTAREIIQDVILEKFPINSEVFFLYWGEGETFGRMGEPKEEIRKALVSTFYWDHEETWLSLAYPKGGGINRQTEHVYKTHGEALCALAVYHEQRLQEVKNAITLSQPTVTAPE